VGPRVAVVSVLAVALLAGCGGGSARPKLPDGKLQKLVLQEQDLPAYDQFVFEREVASDFNPVLHREPNELGRQNGWTARYRRVRSRGSGALTVSSIADVFGRDSDAKKFLDAVDELQAQVGPANGLKKLALDLGDQAVGYATANALPSGVRSVQVMWRKGRYVGTITATGFTRQMSVANVVALARKQDRRLS
jgi:hypothetical protein